MRHKKIAVCMFAVMLGMTALTACTQQSDETDAPATAAKSSAILSDEKKETDCCHQEESCCKNEESADVPDCCGGS